MTGRARPDGGGAGPELLREHVRQRPTGGLRGAVAWLEGYREVGGGPAAHRGLPSPWLTVIITLDEPLTIAQHPDPHQPPSQHTTLIGGLHTAPALITHDGRQAGIQLAVSPLAARALFGVPAGELAGIDLHGAELLGARAGELHEQVAEADSWRERCAVVEQALAPRAVDPPAPELRHAWPRLLTADRHLPVGELAREVGWSSRHLTSRMRAETGLTPSAASRVIRFDRARRRVQARALADDRLDLAQVAAAHGYYDQAHLTRDFTDLAGLPPAQWAREEFRSVQDGAGPAAADSRA